MRVMAVQEKKVVVSAFKLQAHKGLTQLSEL